MNDYSKYIFLALSSSMTTSITTLEDCNEKLRQAEERRKQHEAEKLEKLSQQEKHAQEVRANKEKLLKEASDGQENEEHS